MESRVRRNRESRGSGADQPSPAVVECWVGIHPGFWERWPDRLDRLQKECPHVRMGGKDIRNSPRAVRHTERDEWGCLWLHPGNWLDGQVIEHPLDSWEKLEHWRPPTPAKRIARIYEEARKRPPGSTGPAVSLEHGFLFLRLTYLRGFENFMLDVGEGNPRLYELRDVVTDYWFRVVEAGLACGSKMVHAGDDLGLQDRLPISPDAWRKLIKPGYARIFGPAREHGAEVFLHTDGYIVDIIPDLIEVGVTELNPQDLVNGLDNLARLAKGKVRIALDIDRQSITVFGTAEEIDRHIRRCIETLGSPEGGLRLIWGVYPGTPIENIEAGVRAMERYHDLWVRRG